MRSFTRTNLFLLVAALVLAVAPLVVNVGDSDEEPFTGADSLATEQIVEDNPDYEPWFSSLFEPPSGEIESALFAAQAALGAGFLGYYFGVARTRRRMASTPPTTSGPAVD